jgi:hypothetical protein
MHKCQMYLRHGFVGLLVAAGVVAVAIAQTAPDASPDPTTRPAGEIPPAEQVLNQMLRGSAAQSARPLAPLPDPPAIDRTTGPGAIVPGAPTQAVLREGTFIIDRVGRLTRSADGHHAEFVFESDGKALRDPPMILLPNLKLMAMESAVRASTRDLKFRITGMVTEYNGRNYVLLEKVLVVPEQ